MHSAISIASRARALRVGDGLQPGTQIGPSVSAEQRETVMKYVEIGSREGARLVCGGHALTEGPYAKGFFHEPTIFADVDQSMTIAREEIFGPVLSVIRAKDFEDAMRIANEIATQAMHHVRLEGRLGEVVAHDRDDP